ncbi:MAG: hypothetical protein ACR2MX_19005 [Cyclobacteriaceae bacterium]
MKALLILFVILLFSCPLARAQGEVDAVKGCFSIYKSALLAGNGLEAVEEIDQNTLDYYKTILDHTLRSDSAKVASLDFMDKLIVIRVRDLMTLEEVSALDESSFFVYAVDNGMIGKEGVANLELGIVELNGSSAKGQVIAGGQPAPIHFDFFKEQGNWKIDLTSIFGVSQAALQKVIADSGMTENEFIFQVLEMLTGKQPGKEVWQPMK